MANPEQQGLKPRHTGESEDMAREPKWLIQNNKDWNKVGKKSFTPCLRAEMANPEQQGLKPKDPDMTGETMKVPKWLIQNNKDWNLESMHWTIADIAPKWLIQNNKDWNSIRLQAVSTETPRRNG